MLYFGMAEMKVLDQRSSTKGGGVVRVELWQDQKSKEITHYAMAYVNSAICATDNGRVAGFDNSHAYTGHPTKHHQHWMGVVTHNNRFSTVEQLTDRFERILRRLKRQYGKDY